MKTRFFLHASTILILLGTMIVLMNIETHAQDVRKPTKIATEETGNFQLKYGMGMSTRYLWRGLDLAQSPALEPYGRALIYGLELSIYGVYGIYENAAKHPDFEIPENPENFSAVFLDRIAFTEVISNIFYHINTNLGTFRLGVTEYYFPDRLVKEIEVDSFGIEHISYPKSTWLNWKDNGEGAHVIEASIKFIGKKGFPFWGIAALNVYNDPDNSLYLEAGYNFNVLSNNLGIVAGGAVGGSKWYQFTVKNGKVRDGSGLTNFGITFSREIYLESWLILDFGLSDIINFYQERNTILFKATLKIE